MGSMRWRLALAAMAVLVPGVSSAQESLDPILRPIGYVTQQYGPVSRQALDLSPAGATSPIAVIVGCDLWRSRPCYGVQNLMDKLRRSGFAIAKIGFPDGDMRATATNIARAIATLRDGTEKFDRNRILLVGDGSGAAAVGLVAADPTLLAEADVPRSAVRGVVVLNAEGLDGPGDWAGASEWRRGALSYYIGGEPAGHLANTAVGHLADDPGAIPWLVGYASPSRAAADAAERFAGKLRDAHVPVQTIALGVADESSQWADIIRRDRPLVKAIEVLLAKPN